ncbi:GpE family phage tail protein [Fodinicurvata sp. EGI_FJ10296]|uniref:GpE family phage tail protein n=1 Tax=Fodinicurvata sp. EGI_FJ10296 TaxID=3231908 RepID=UPI003455C373
MGSRGLEALIAVVAAVFHWPLSEIDQLTPAELVAWADRAIACHKALSPRM